MLMDKNKYIAQFLEEPVFKDDLWSIKYRFTLAHKWEKFSNPSENIVRAQYNALNKKFSDQYIFCKQNER